MMTTRTGVWRTASALIAFAAPAATADAPPPRNVLLIVCDDLNVDVGCFGHPLVKTPNIDRLAARGVRFDRTYCQYPLCGPSRASFLTGLYPTQTGVLDNKKRFRDRRPDAVTLPQYFRARGYFTARVGKIFHYGVPSDIGTDGLDDPPSWDTKVNPRGIDCTVDDRIHRIIPGGKLGGSLSWLRLESRDEDHTDGIGAAEAIRLMEEHQPKKTGRPFFLAVGFYRPHVPLLAPGKYFDLYPPDRIDPPVERPGDADDIPAAALADKIETMEISLETRREIVQAYYASITFADAQVGRVLDALDRLGLANDTVVVLMSDHGWLLGQHGLWHKNRLFEPAVRLPLIIAEPGNPNTGKGSAALVELVDLYPTLAGLCGLPAPSEISGRSFVPVLRDPAAPHREEALSFVRSRAVGPDEAGAKKVKRGEGILGASIRSARYRYTEWGENGEEGLELYDEEKDPEEWTNLAMDAKSETILREHKDRLKRAVTAAAGER